MLHRWPEWPGCHHPEGKRFVSGQTSTLTQRQRPPVSAIPVLIKGSIEWVCDWIRGDDLMLWCGT